MIRNWLATGLICTNDLHTFATGARHGGNRVRMVGKYLMYDEVKDDKIIDILKFDGGFYL